MRVRHELRVRVVTAVALAALTAAAWLWMIDMAATDRHAIMSCCGISLPMTFVMWAVMMVGMMVPSAAPMVMLIARTSRRSGTPHAFVAGYLAMWSAFSLVAALAQWALFHAGLLDPHRQTTTPWLAGLLLIAAGLFQLTPIKSACLERCRSPFGFLVTDWRDGIAGGLIMGIKHGMSCTGCCWLVMALLFVAGVMNLWWVALITMYVLVEKLVVSPRFMRTAGGALVVAGVLMLAVG